MENSIFIYIAFVVLIVVISYLLGRAHSRRKQEDFPQDIIDLYRKVDGLPVRIMQTIQGSINPQKGKMAELLTMLSLGMIMTGLSL